MVAGTVGGEVRQTSWEFLQLIFSRFSSSCRLPSESRGSRANSQLGRWGNTFYIAVHHPPSPTIRRWSRPVDLDHHSCDIHPGAGSSHLPLLQNLLLMQGKPTYNLVDSSEQILRILFHLEETMRGTCSHKVSDFLFRQSPRVILCPGCNIRDL